MTMKFNFSKYHGAGNDFILSNDLFLLNEGESERGKIINLLCDRRLGIGADGFMFLENKAGKELKVYFYNSDGKRGSLCGNGSRCALTFALKSGFINTGSIDFYFWETKFSAGCETDKVKIKMKDIHLKQSTELGFFTDTGSPHLIVEIDLSQSTKDTLLKEALYLRHHPLFKKGGGTNVNFIELHPNDMSKCSVFTFERGVEDFTYACGTGAVAIAAYLAWKRKSGGVYTIISKGGTLEVEIGNYSEILLSDVWLSGPVQKVYEGKVDLEDFLTS